MSEDRLYLRKQIDAAIVPPDLIWRTKMSYGARIAAQIILYNNQHGYCATRSDIAERLGADIRSVDRWLMEMRDAGLLEASQRGRTRLFELKTTDMSIVDSLIYSRQNCRASTNDKDVYDRQFDLSCLALPDAPYATTHDKTIDSAPVGVGGIHDSIESDQHHTRPLATKLARWLKHVGVNKAHVFDDPKLDFELYKHDFERKKGMGWSIGMIVNAWIEAPLEAPAAPAAPAEEQLAEELGDDMSERPWLGRSLEEAQERFDRMRAERKRML